MTTTITPFEQEAKKAEGEILSTTEKVDALVIKTDDDFNRAGDFANEISTRTKGIDKTRRFFTDPLNEQVDRINGVFMPQVKAGEALYKKVKAKMAEYFDKKEKARLAEEARLKAIRDKADAKRLAEGKDVIAAPVRVVEEVQKTQTGDVAQSVATKKWTHEILKISDFPADITKAILEEAYRKGIIKSVIQKFVDAGMREIPGVRIYQEVNISTRRLK